MRKKQYRYKAAELYAGGRTDRLWLSKEHKGLVLEDSLLVEDDAPGGGYETFDVAVAGPVRICKELFVEQMPVSGAWVLVQVADAPPAGASAVIDINGTRHECTLSRGWNQVPAEPDSLVKGGNRLVLSASGSESFTVPAASRGSIIENDAARFGLPVKSCVSADNGVAWSTDLGGGPDTPGEFAIRLRLVQFVSGGGFTSMVIDLADPGNRTGIKPRVSVEGFKPRITCDIPAGTELIFYYRTGTEPTPAENTWDAWRDCRQDQWCQVRGRYFQGRIMFKTADPLATPVVRAVSLQCGVTPLVTVGGGLIKCTSGASPAPPVSGIRFRYEQPRHRYLERLYRQAGLKAVTAGADNSFKKLLALTAWTAQQRNCAAFGPSGPCWNSLDILGGESGAGTQSGCCCQFAVVLTQAALACGIQARIVLGSISGYIPLHHMVEAWCDEYRKWILLDPVLDTHYIDAGSLEPLHALDLYRRLTAKTGAKRKKKAVDALSITPEAAAETLEERDILVRRGGHVNKDFLAMLYGTARTGSLRLLPRNNLFSETYPVPRVAPIPAESGWNGWWHWDDDKGPWEMRFVRSSAREDDFYWPVNRIHLTGEVTDRPGMVRIYLQATAPDLDTFLVSVGNGPWESSGSEYLWHLQEGPNTLKARVRTVHGHECGESAVGVNYSR